MEQQVEDRKVLHKSGTLSLRICAKTNESAVEIKIFKNGELVHLSSIYNPKINELAVVTGVKDFVNALDIVSTDGIFSKGFENEKTYRFSAHYYDGDFKTAISSLLWFIERVAEGKDMASEILDRN